MKQSRRGGRGINKNRAYGQYAHMPYIFYNHRMSDLGKKGGIR